MIQRMKNFEIRGYTPKEAAELCGISTQAQRDWRHRGLMPSDRKGTTGGWTSFDHIEVAALAIMAYAAQELELRLDFAKTCAMAAAPHVTFFMSRHLSGKAAEVFRKRYQLEGGSRFMSVGKRNGLPAFWDEPRKAFADSASPALVVIDLESMADVIVSKLHKMKMPLVEEH